MPRLLRGYVGLGCTPNRRRRTRMRTGTTVSVRHNTSTPIPQGKNIIFETYIFQQKVTNMLYYYMLQILLYY